MSDTSLARYHFLSWTRRGVATSIKQPDQGSLPARASLSINLGISTIQGTTTTVTDANPMNMEIFGPGDVIGIDPRHIVRTEPRNFTVNFEPNYLLGQLPVKTGDRWLGLPIDTANPPDKGPVAFTCFTQGSPASTTPYAGLMVDEWPERIPSTDEKAAVAFHYEKPKARAPQTLLLAVCPDDRQTWDDDLLAGTLQETLELAKIRTVDLNSVLRVGDILPALYFALNLQGATVSTNFLTVKEIGLSDTAILYRQS